MDGEERRQICHWPVLVSVFWFRPPQNKAGNFAKLEERFQDGVWLGLRPGSNEVWIGTPSGVVLARTVRRKPDNLRWSFEELMAIKGTPWEPAPSAKVGWASSSARAGRSGGRNPHPSG